VCPIAAITKAGTGRPDFHRLTARMLHGRPGSQ
jgi:hypothetical protein